MYPENAKQLYNICTMLETLSWSKHKFLYNISTMLDQRRRRWADVK